MEHSFNKESLSNTLPFFSNLLDATPALIQVYHLQTGQYVFVNEVLKEMLGYEPEDFMKGGVSFVRSLLHPDDAASFEKQRPQNLGDLESGLNVQKVVLDNVYRLCGKDGRWVWLRTRTKVFDFSPDGRIEHLISVSFDITDIKKVKEHLRQANYDLEKRMEKRSAELEASQRQLNLIVNSVPALIAYVDREGRYQFLNQGYQNWFGSRARDWIGKKVSEALGEETYRRLKPHFEKALSGELASFQTRISTANGERFIDVRYIPDKDSTGEVRGFIALILDISDLTQARIQSEEKANQFVTLAESVPQLVYTSSPQGEDIFQNQRWKEYTGFYSDETLGHGWTQAIHPDDREKAFSRYMHSVRTGGPYEVEYRLRRHDGVYRWFLSRALPVRGHDGTIRLWVGTCTDMDELKRHREELARKNEELSRINRDLDNFIYTASHDLRAPIVNIEGLVGILSEIVPPEVSAQPDFSETIGLISQAVRRFKETVRDLSEITMAIRDDVDDISNQDIASLLEEIRMDILPEIQKSGATILVETQAWPTIRFSRRNLRSILYNLLSNAVKYRSPERAPVVRISTRHQPEGILLTVEDNGIGIPEKFRPKLFSMFKRFHEQVDGSGIGLYIIKRIVENAGGTIAVESEEGKGSVFRVLFRTEDGKTEKPSNRVTE